MGNVAYKVTGRLIKDTGTGLIIEDSRGIRYFAPTHNVLETETKDLFAPL